MARLPAVAAAAAVVALLLAGGADADCFSYCFKNCVANDKSMADYCNYACDKTCEPGAPQRPQAALVGGGTLQCQFTCARTTCRSFATGGEGMAPCYARCYDGCKIKALPRAVRAGVRPAALPDHPFHKTMDVVDPVAPLAGKSFDEKMPAALPDHPFHKKMPAALPDHPFHKTMDVVHQVAPLAGDSFNEKMPAALPDHPFHKKMPAALPDHPFGKKMPAALPDHPFHKKMPAALPDHPFHEKMPAALPDHPFHHEKMPAALPDHPFHEKMPAALPDHPFHKVPSAVKPASEPDPDNVGFFRSAWSRFFPRSGLDPPPPSPPARN
ncbi:hypothetical protein ACP70R_037269 [Stipagrostis hirtigluma subsp. patula]